ncbi:DUF7882 family protein [Subtercola sp. YIM 133946]|uniref:DUF7882 family protein n=1 Tax=Subtercola sp. YIM 133946 TaxID=3118909 RepID=UPI003FCD10A1
MGSFTYDGAEIELDDRTLTHLQIVIVQKLRRCESFAMSWAVSPESGSGRASIWLHPSIPLHFRFNGSRVPAINPAWLEELAASADSSRGLIVTPENPHVTGAPRVQPAPQRRERQLEPA